MAESEIKSINGRTIADMTAREGLKRAAEEIAGLESLLKTIQEKLNSGSSVDTVTVNEINEMIVEYFESKTVSEVEA